MCTAQAGTFMQMVAADRSSKANARIMRQNAKMAAFRAEMVRNRGRMEEIHSRNRTKKTLGTARTAIASNGFAVDSGSALDRVGDIASAGELDALTIRYNTEMDARALETQAGQYQMMAGLERQKGKFSMLAGATSIATQTIEDYEESQKASDVLLSGRTVHERWYRPGY
ncbi:MAG: hypothetical protein ABW118_13990 [Candidatus Thiodiazotropha sp.]